MNEKLQTRLSNQLSSLVQEITGEVALASMTELKATDLFLKTPLGAVADDLGINPTLATQLVSDDPTEAIDVFSSRFGYHPLVI